MWIAKSLPLPMDGNELGIKWKTLAAMFLGTLAVYLAAFHGMEYLRVRQGPWKVEFDPANKGGAAMVVTQSHLDIRGFKILFEGAGGGELEGGLVVFENPALNAGPMDQIPESKQELKQRPFKIPFGQCVYQDLMFLPGVVTLEVLGCQIELMPRTLVVNRREIPWDTPGGLLSIPAETWRPVAQQAAR